MHPAHEPGHRFSTPEEALKAHWGYDAFRGIQKDVITTVLNGQDGLALMPTGGGKSLCYQVPALVKPGVCIVISPLIALMKDQVHNLKERGIRAAALYSGLNRREQEAIYDRAQFGGLELLYLSPERLLTEWARIRIQQTEVSLLAVDEAHCISQWGHDFRPAYRQIAEIREFLPETPVLALTATATPKVADDICHQLNFGLNSVRHQMSFARDNLTYAMREVDDKATKLVQALNAIPGSAVVYARNRGRTRSLAIELTRRGISATHYHAGLTLEERDAAQQAWLKDEVRVVVATNAFGMGIDKPDVRLVCHVDLPDTLEAYFQEAGRGGRDGKQAYSLLLFQQSDASLLQRQLDASSPQPDELKRVYHKLGNYCNLALGAGEGAAYDFDLVAFAKTYDLEPLNVANALRILQMEGLVYVTDAVFRPAMICMLASKEELYDYCLRNPKLDKLVQTILRTHHGSFQQFVYLKERELSHYLGMTTFDLKGQLSLLQRQKIIDYRPQGELPQLIWTVARVPREHLAVDWKSLRERQEIKQARLKAAIKYATTQTCRRVQLLGYFGEEAEPCGRCDVCIEDKKKTKDVPERYILKVKSVLQRQPLEPADVLEAFQERHHDAVLGAIAYLLREGQLTESGGVLTLSETEKA